MKIQEGCQDCQWLHFYDIFNLIPLVSFLRILLDTIDIFRVDKVRSHWFRKGRLIDDGLKCL